jgi:hypothetical protein
MTVKPLYKTTVIIWTESNLTKVDFPLTDLAVLSECEYVHFSSLKSVLIEEPEKDPSWKDRDFWDD